MRVTVWVPASGIKKRKDTQYSIRLLPIGGFCALDGQDEDAGDERCLARQGFWKKFIILAGVSFMNLLTGIVIIAIRNGELIVLEDLPLYRGTYGERQNSFGLQVGAKQVPADFLTNLRFIGYQPLDFVQQMRFSIIQMMRGNVSVKEFSGPVGIMSIMTEVGTSSESASSAARDIAFLAALIAIKLAVMNVLPLPALDGGRIFFLLVDVVELLLFKHKVPEKCQAAVNAVGFVLLMGVMALVTLQDVIKLISGGFKSNLFRFDKKQNHNYGDGIEKLRRLNINKKAKGMTNQ